MPVAEGTFRLRHGYQLFNNPGAGLINRFYSYQNLGSSVRKLVYIANTSVLVSAEDGTGLSTIISTSNANSRAVNSRDYEFFPNIVALTTWPSGQQSDGKKWHSVHGLSDWGLAQPLTAVNVTSTAVAGNITLTSTVGRVYAGAFLNSITGHYSDFNVGVGSLATNVVTNPGTTATQTTTGLVAWTNVNNVKLNDGVDATVGLSVPNPSSETILLTGFGFAIPGTATILGVQVSVKKRVTAGTPGSVTDGTVQLIKGGVQSGNNNAAPFDWFGTYTTSIYGGSNDLWGLTLTPTDVNAANFGIAFQGTQILLGTQTLAVDFISITITYATGAGANSGPVTSKQIALSLPTANPPTGADMFAILATLDGGDTNTFYLLDTVPIASTTYIDNIPDNVLATKNIAAQVDDLGIQHGLVENQFPPIGMQFPTKHRGRLFGVIGDTLVFSKSLDEVTTSTGLVLGRYEEAWPVLNSISISTERETVRGLISDGNTLYIGTERHIWRLNGDGPLNFSKPEVIFNEVGVIDQDCWQVVFSEGQPVGMTWMTPDFRVIMSNFASYQDIGTPIQDILSSVNPSAIGSIWAQFFSRQEFDLYLLAIPTGNNTTPDTLCIYDLRTQRWFIWKLTDLMSFGLMNVTSSGVTQWLFAASTGKLYQMLPSLTQDRVSDTPVSYSANAKTVWLHLGRPTEIKTLNEIEVITADSGMLVTVAGASTSAQAQTPLAVVTNAPLVLSPRGFLKTYLAAQTSKSRYYQFTFTSSNGIADVLQGYNIEAVPFPY